MDDAQLSPAGVALLAALALASLTVLFRLFVKHIDGRPLLSFEPRRPVPWTFEAPLIALLIGVLPSALNLAAGARVRSAPLPLEPSAVVDAATASAAAMAAPAETRLVTAAAMGAAVAVRHAAEGADAFIKASWSQAAGILFLTATSFALLGAVYRATPVDLGLPQSWRQFRGDVAIGATACLASLLPIYSLLILFAYFFQPEPQVHELINRYVASPSPLMFATVAMAAVIVAPIFEEMTFRLVFQGWLERIDMLRRQPPTPPINVAEEGVLAVPLKLRTEEWVRPAWWPVIVSGMLFGIAHFEQSLAPIPLALFGCVLGYLYQRTHRLVPSIVCHLLFNAISLVQTWLQFG